MIATLALEARRDLRRRAEAATSGRWAAATPSDDTPESRPDCESQALDYAAAKLRHALDGEVNR